MDLSGPSAFRLTVSSTAPVARTAPLSCGKLAGSHMASGGSRETLLIVIVCEETYGSTAFSFAIGSSCFYP